MSSPTADEAALKELIAGELGAVRDRSFGLTTDVLAEDDLTAQVSPLMSPLVWDLAHVGNYEELWLLRAATGQEAMRPEIDDLYDAFEHPRSERPTLPLLPPEEARAYIGTVRSKVLDSLSSVRFDTANPLTSGGFVYGMVVQHEHMHDETMLATHQLRKGAPALLDPVAEPLRTPGEGTGADEALIEAGPFQMGTSDEPWAYDNERPVHIVDLPAYYIDVEPVTNAAYIAFIEAGGYDEPRWWDPAGWEWRNRSGKRAPAFWDREGGSGCGAGSGGRKPSRPASPSSTCAGTRRTPTRGGPGRGFRPRPSGRRPPAGTRPRSGHAATRGATCSRRGVPTSGRRRCVRRRPAPTRRVLPRTG